MRRTLLAVFVTGTPSKRTMDLPENGAITTSVGSRDSARRLFLHRVGVTLTYDDDGEAKTKESNLKNWLAPKSTSVIYLECTHIHFMCDGSSGVQFPHGRRQTNTTKQQKKEFLITNHN